MAIQNFVSGGFYGKLGAMIGQRWKNKRTLKAYAIPHNPRTAKQQANRSLFGGFTAVAQLGQQMNYKAPCFVSDSRTDWNLRMEQASLLKKANQTNLNLIPVYPNGYTPAYTITAYTYTRKISDTEVQITITGTLPTASRSLSVLVAFYDSTTQQYDMELYNATTTVGDKTTFNIKNTDASRYDETTHFYVVSNDDSSNSDEMLFGEEKALVVSLPEEVAFDTSVKSVTSTETTYNATTGRYASTLTLVFNQAYVEGTQTISEINIHGVSRGEWNNLHSSSPTLKNIDGNFGISIATTYPYPENVYAFPNGSYVTFGSINIDAGDKIYIASDTKDSFESTDLTRKFKSIITAYSVSDGVASVAMANNLTNFVQPSGGVSFYAVKYGVFTTQTMALLGFNRTRFAFKLSARSGFAEEAAPTGSTIAVNFTETIKGVTYEPFTTTAQAVTEGSPIRSVDMTSGTYFKDEDAEGYEYDFNSDATFDEEVATNSIYTAVYPFSEQEEIINTFSFFKKSGTKALFAWDNAITGYFGCKELTMTPETTLNGVVYRINTVTLGDTDTSKSEFVIAAGDLSWEFINAELFSKQTSLNEDFKTITGLTLDTLSTAFGDVSTITPDFSNMLVSGVYDGSGGTFTDKTPLDVSFTFNGSDYSPNIVLSFNFEYMSEDYSVNHLTKFQLTKPLTIPVQDTSIANARPLVFNTFIASV